MPSKAILVATRPPRIFGGYMQNTIISPKRPRATVIEVINIREVISHPERWEVLRENMQLQLEEATSEDSLEIRIIQRP